jgi:hypothetical protein
MNPFWLDLFSFFNAHQLPWLSVCSDGLLFVFQFCRAVWFWVQLTGSGDESCDLLPALLLEWIIAHLLSTFLPFQFLFTDSLHRD